MEGQKDNNHQSQKDIDKQLLNPEEVLFNSSPQDLYIYRKIEKISAAIHLITNFFDLKEPIRMSLREKSLALLSSSAALVKNSDLSNILNSLSFGLLEIKSLLHTSFISGLMSEMNLKIIQGEIDQLMIVIESKKQVFIRLPITYLHVAPLEPKSSASEAPQIQSAPAFNNNPISFPGSSGALSTNFPSNVSEIQRSQSRLNISKGQISKGQKNSADHSDRTEKILSLLKDGRALTIKDFSDVIKGCSEKTLQRELLRLVAEGKIIKRGERRWSRYSLS
jgi:hypothetical protein